MRPLSIDSCLDNLECQYIHQNMSNQEHKKMPTQSLSGTILVQSYQLTRDTKLPNNFRPSPSAIITHNNVVCNPKLDLPKGHFFCSPSWIPFLELIAVSQGIRNTQTPSYLYHPSFPKPKGILNYAQPHKPQLNGQSFQSLELITQSWS